MWIGQQYAGLVLKRMSPLPEPSTKNVHPQQQLKTGNAPQRMRKLSEVNVAVIGLGYVGLPLATEFGKLRSVVGFDVNQARIDALEKGYDATLEVSPEELQEASHLRFQHVPRRSPTAMSL